MKIDNEKLKEILAEKSDLSPEEIDVQLNELIRRIRETAERGKALEIKGLGLFYLSRDGTLDFDPSEDFATEINYKYAGMEPVEVGAGPSESTAEDSGFEASPEEDHLQATAPANVADEETLESAGSSRKKAAVTDSGSADRIKAAAERKKKERDSIVTLIVTVIAIIVLTTILMLVMDRPGEDMESDAVAEEATVEPAEQAQDLEEDTLDLEAIGPEADVPEFSQGDLEPIDESLIPDGTPDSDPELAGDTPVQADEGPYGLYGDSREIGHVHYSIILYSLQNRSRVEETEESLIDDGYRAVISETRHQEHGRLWRVGVGQFETISDAQSAARELPETYRDNHFIGRIP